MTMRSQTLAAMRRDQVNAKTPNTLKTILGRRLSLRRGRVVVKAKQLVLPKMRIVTADSLRLQPNVCMGASPHDFK